VTEAPRLEQGTFLVTRRAPESHQAARADLIASLPPSPAPRGLRTRGGGGGRERWWPRVCDGWVRGKLAGVAEGGSGGGRESVKGGCGENSMARAASRAHWCDPLARSVEVTWVELRNLREAPTNARCDARVTERLASGGRDRGPTPCPWTVTATGHDAVAAPDAVAVAAPVCVQNPDRCEERMVEHRFSPPRGLPHPMSPRASLRVEGSPTRSERSLQPGTGTATAPGHGSRTWPSVTGSATDRIAAE
jgi:hypothetical protein